MEDRPQRPWTSRRWGRWLGIQFLFQTGAVVLLLAVIRLPGVPFLEARLWLLWQATAWPVLMGDAHAAVPLAALVLSFSVRRWILGRLLGSFALGYYSLLGVAYAFRGV